MNRSAHDFVSHFPDIEIYDKEGKLKALLSKGFLRGIRNCPPHATTLIYSDANLNVFGKSRDKMLNALKREDPPAVIRLSSEDCWKV